MAGCWVLLQVRIVNGVPLCHRLGHKSDFFASLYWLAALWVLGKDLNLFFPCYPDIFFTGELLAAWCYPDWVEDVMNFPFFFFFLLREKERNKLFWETPSVSVLPWLEMEVLELSHSSAYKKSYQQKGWTYSSFCIKRLTGALRQVLLFKLSVRSANGPNLLLWLSTWF